MGRPLHGRIFKNIPDLCPSDGLFVTVTDNSRACPVSPGGQGHAWWRAMHQTQEETLRITV